MIARVVLMPILSALSVPELIMMTTLGTASDVYTLSSLTVPEDVIMMISVTDNADKIGIMKTLGFLCM